MTTHKFTDTMPVTGQIKQTDDGAVVMARVARGGNVQDYLGSEMGLFDREIIRVYRPSDAVFSRDAIESYARKPITINHPDGGVSADNWKDLAVGEIDRDVMRDGDFVSVPLIFRDATAIALIKSSDGPKELSMGYDASIEFKDGVTPTGEPYDAIMSDFRMNHVAVVSQARGGKELRIGDGAYQWGATPIHTDEKEVTMTDNLQSVVLGDAAVNVTASDKATIEKFKADTAKTVSDMETAHAAAIAAKDADIAKADAAKDAAEAKVLSDADIDKRVADRAALITSAKAIDADVKTDGVADADIRKAVVVAKLGDAMAGKDQAYIDARFDILSEDASNGDPIADAIKDAKTVNGLNAVYAARDAALSEAWKNPAKKEA